MEQYSSVSYMPNPVMNVKHEEIVVTVVVPVLNEGNYIEKCIESILDQTYPQENMEVLFIDGKSTDQTIALISRYINVWPHLRILSNPYRTVQHALNIGIMNSRGTYIVRLDAHAEFAEDYIAKCIEFIQKTGADNVGGPMRARGRSHMQKVIAAAYHSSFALGGGKFHDETYEGYADTVWLGAYKKKTIEEVGLYDVNFPRSEDDELNYRIIKNSGKIYLTPEIKSVYYPRDNVKELFKQYFEYGVWKVAVIRKHKKPARISHLIPMCFVMFLIFFGIGSFASQYAACLFGFVMSLYMVINIYFSFSNNHIQGLKGRFMLLFVHSVLHISYGFGFLIGILKGNRGRALSSLKNS